MAGTKDSVKWPMVKLGELCSETRRRVGTANLPVYSITKHQGFVSNYFKKDVHSKDLSKYKVVEAGDFAYATIHLDEGSIGIAPETVAISPMYTTFSASDPRIDPSYLLRFLKSDVALAHYQILGTGSIERRKNINFKALSELRIPLPPLDEQRRIAEILDSIQTQALQLERKIECLDMIMQSAVEGLVSDSSSDLVLVDDVAEVSGGLALGKRDSKLVQAPYLRVANVFRNRLELDEIKILRATDKELERTGLKAGDILIVEAHGNAAEVGRAAVLTEDLTGYTFQNHLFRARVRDDSIDPALLCRILNSHFVRQQMAKRVSTTSGLKTTSISKIRSLKIPLPSSEVQRSFAAVLEVHSQLMYLNNDRRQRIQELQKSLSIRAFQGEL